jgi:hypothetical protein
MTKTTRVPEDSVLRRHYLQMQEAGLLPAAENESPPVAPSAPSAPAPAPAPVQKGFFSRLLAKLFGN